MVFLCLLLVKSYMNYFDVVWNYYYVTYSKIIMMVYFTNIIYNL